MKMFIDVIVLIFITSFFHVWLWSQSKLKFRLVLAVLLLCLPGRVYADTEECLRREIGWMGSWQEPWLSGWAGQSAPWIWSLRSCPQAAGSICELCGRDTWCN